MITLSSVTLTERNSTADYHCIMLLKMVKCTLIDELNCESNTKGSKGTIPLHYAALGGHVEIVRKLVHEYQCDVMAKEDNGDTPLHSAAFGGSLSTVCTLIDEFKCDPNTKGSKGTIPLQSAALVGHVDIVFSFDVTFIVIYKLPDNINMTN
ncbi:hypothetical protein EMCRGX_G032620 [Ephydatia muelleri]